MENRGLTSAEAEKSRAQYGANILNEYKRKSFLKCFILNITDPIIKVLLIALFINIIFMFPNINWFESGGIATSVIIATLVSTVSEYSSENAFEKLKEKNKLLIEQFTTLMYYKNMHIIFILNILIVN